MLTSRGLGRVLGDLATMGFDARWGVLGAADVGAVHQRDRIWIVGKNTDSNSIRSQKNSNEEELCRQTKNIGSAGRFSEMGCKEIWARPCPIGASPMGVGNGVAGGVDRLKAIGNGQVPLCAATAWRILSE